MKTVIAATVIFGIACGVACATDPLTEQLEISGTVHDMGSISGRIIDPGSNTSSSGVGVSVNEMTTATATPKSFEFLVSFDLVTNYKARVGLYSENGSLKTEATPIDSNYTNYVAYSAEVYVGPIATAVAYTILNADNSAESHSSELSDEFNPFSGKLNITVSSIMNTSNTSKKLIPGSYSDTLTVKVGSNL